MYQPESRTSIWKTLFAATATALEFVESKYKIKKVCFRLGAWLVFSTAKRVTWCLLYIELLTLVCLSRLFIGAHFPHQVLLGVIMGVQTCKNTVPKQLPGIIIGHLCSKIPISKSDWHYFELIVKSAALGSVVITYLTHMVLADLLEWDIHWSIALAQK